ncbi:MAG TPA: LuxR C-terminal-related transcriptional regulator, partial [Propionibacteriaceae bacterium]
MFAEMDLTAWVLRAADELAATGARPRTRRSHPTEPLNSQETGVVLHAAKAMSNKEIAAALFLSPKTVEHHLSSVYRKRGFRSPRGARRFVRSARGRLTRATIRAPSPSEVSQEPSHRALKQIHVTGAVV